MVSIAAGRTTPPALPRDLVGRPALRRALDEGAGKALTVVCAPPGFGKSLLLADWLRRSPEVPAAWVSLDEEDDDPRLLWSAVLAALRGCGGVPASNRVHRLVVSRTTVERDFLDDLLAALAALPHPLRLVLDDVHALRAAPVLEQLRMLVLGHPTGLHLVVASRLDPPLPLSRLRLDDELCELRAEQLRFTAEETTALFDRGGVRLDPEHRDVLHRRTGGWVAGLRLAQRALRDHPDPGRFVAEFSGDVRSVSDYLVGEALAGISDVQRDVLLRVSVADPVPAALAVELCGREDAADVLDALCHDPGLVTASGPDRSDYRIQALLRSHLLADLRRAGDGVVAAGHRRAASWWDRQGDPAPALRHARQAGDPALVVDLLGRWAATLVARGEGAALRVAMDGLGDGPRAACWRSALAACLDLERGNRAGVADGVRAARASAPAPDPGLAALLTAVERLAGIGCGPPGAAAEPHDEALRALVRAGRGVARLAGGVPADARADLQAALADAQRLRFPLLEVQSRCLLAVVGWVEGDVRAAEESAAAATAAARDGGWDGSGWAACAHAVTALAALERGCPDAALEAADAGLGVGVDLDPVVRFALHAARGGARFDRGEKAAGMLELQQALADVAEQVLPPALAAESALIEHRIALRLGYATAAAGAASWLAPRPGTRAEGLLIRAWGESAAGAFRAARSTVGPLLRRSTRPAWPATVVEAWLVVAGAALEDGDRVGARRALRVALDEARALDVVRPFVLASPGLRALLVDGLVVDDDRGRFTARVLAAMQRPAPAPVALTARERDVLARLPSLLNLDEIADDLTISVNTVKSHIRSIYDKLGAGTRRTAVLAAHERGLLRVDPVERPMSAERSAG